MLHLQQLLPAAIRTICLAAMCHKEMLVMFPNVPAASLFWDFIDVVGNETAPKSIYLGGSAAGSNGNRVFP